MATSTRQSKQDLSKLTNEAEQIAEKLSILKSHQERYGRTTRRDLRIRALQKRRDELVRIIQSRAKTIGLMSH